ncbi:MAG TPA: DUF6162 family protein [Stellaceae bacterium]|jgi:hypothetical protein|nr:DUF6162 family protein [Stellaceae bacterium]
MHSQIVKPATGHFEGAYLLAVCVVVLSVCGALIVQRHTTLETVQLQPYQISAFADLSKTEQGVFNDLYAAALELQSVHRDNQSWLSVDDLQDLAIPPFAETALTKTRGGHLWTAIPFEGKGASSMGYFGKTTRTSEARSFFLVMTYRPPQVPAGAASDPNAGRSFAIWVNGAAAVAAPTAIDTAALADLGWREAVAFKGDQVQQGLTAGAAK